MSDINQIEVFEDKNIRRMRHQEDWRYSVVDVVRALTESSEPKRYWSDLKIKLKEEGSEVVTINNQLYGKIVQLKLQSSDGKFYETDCANLEGIFRIIQSIPSKRIK
jgi:TATA-binding protein-associated factor Taf7